MAASGGEQPGLLFFTLFKLWTSSADGLFFFSRTLLLPDYHLITQPLWLFLLDSISYSWLTYPFWGFQLLVLCEPSHGNQAVLLAAPVPTTTTFTQTPGEIRHTPWMQSLKYLSTVYCLSTLSIFISASCPPQCSQTLLLKWNSDQSQWSFKFIHGFSEALDIFHSFLKGLYDLSLGWSNSRTRPLLSHMRAI